jgi:TRAP-type C4-dicarboxylate transport system substrate-binding protein
VLFRIDELAKSHTYINLTRINQEHCLSRKWYEALPPDLKVVVSRWAQGFSQAIAQQFYVLDGARARVKFRKEGINIVHLTDAQKARWQAKVAPVTAEWIKQNDAQGRPAKELVDFIRQRAAHYAKMTPEQIMRETIEHPVGDFISK